MATVPLTSVLHHLRWLAVDDQSDSQLLERFAASADESAFAALVRRHGGLVLGVSRRILGPGADPDDVFQATFLILSQRAKSIRKQASVASWLYGVAFRLALRLKSQRSTRRRNEQAAEASLEHVAEKTSMRADASAHASLRELAAILDEEMQALPAACRDALVHCHLEGLSCTEAAQHLGWPVGTLKGRLMRGRNLLRKRLERRGITLSLAALAVALGDQAQGAVPAALARATVRCVVGKDVSAKVAALAETTASVLTVGKAKHAVLTILALSLCAFGATLFPSPAASPKPASSAAQIAPAAGEPPLLKDLFNDPLPRGAVVRLGTVRWRHGAPALFLRLLPDGKTAVSAANDRFVRVWDQATGVELRRFGPGPLPEAGPNMLVSSSWKETAVAVSTDGLLVAAYFGQQAVDVWEIATGKKVHTIPLSDNPRDLGALAFAPDGKRLALARASGPIRLYDFATGRIQRELGHAPREDAHNTTAGQVTCLFAPDGKTLVGSHAEKNGEEVVNHLHFWDPDTGKERFTATAAGLFGIHSLAFSPDGKLFAYATHAGDICVLNPADGAPLRQWNVVQPPAWLSLAFSPDSAKLYSKSSYPYQLKEWDVKAGKLLRNLPNLAGGNFLFFQYAGPNGCLALSPDGKTLAVGGGSHTIRFVNLATAQERSDPAGDSHSMLALGFTPDGKSAVTRSANAQYQRWDAATGRLQKQWPTPRQGYNFVVSPGGNYVAVRDQRKILLLDAAAEKELATIPAGNFRMPIFFFSPDGKTLLVRRLDDNAATLYDVPSGKERCRVDVGPPFAGPNETLPVTYFFAADGRRLAVYWKGGRSLAVHDAATGKVLQSVEMAHVVENRQPCGAFSPDGRTVAIDYRNGLVEVVELATRQVRQSYGKKSTPKAGWPSPLEYAAVWPGAPGSTLAAFSPDGRLLAQVGIDNKLAIWDVAAGHTLAQLDGHTGPIATIAFTPDGRRLASASGDTTALLWDMETLSAKAGLPPRVLNAEAVKACWVDLASKDALGAFAAIKALTAAPGEALPFLKEVLQPASPPEPKRIGALIDLLDSEDFKVRQKAQADLLKIGDVAAPYLARRLEGTMTLEMQKRLQEIHGKVTTPLWTADRLQVARAIEVLERIGNGEARSVLKTLADGAAGALATVEAQAALERSQARFISGSR